MRWLFVALLATVIAVPVALVGFATWATQHPAPQPASNQNAAVVRVPVRTREDRADLVAIVRDTASRNHLNFVDVSQEYRRLTDGKQTIYIGLYRTAENPKTIEVLVSDIDGSNAASDPMVLFLRGEDPALAKQARDALLAELQRRWPDILVTIDPVRQ